MIEDYYQTLLETIAASPLVRSSEVVLDKRTSQVGLVRGDLYFANDSRLHFRELVEFRVDVVTRHMYSFHYQDSEEIMVFRYDDTEHYPDLPNFPHPKHVGSSQEVVSAQPPDLMSDLQEIEQIYPLKS